MGSDRPGPVLADYQHWVWTIWPCGMLMVRLWGNPITLTVSLETLCQLPEYLAATNIATKSSQTAEVHDAHFVWLPFLVFAHLQDARFVNTHHDWDTSNLANHKPPTTAGTGPATAQQTQQLEQARKTMSRLSFCFQKKSKHQGPRGALPIDEDRQFGGYLLHDGPGY